MKIKKLNPKNNRVELEFTKEEFKNIDIYESKEVDILYFLKLKGR